MRLILVAIAALSLPASGFAQPREQPKVYRYTDANGVVRYSDSIPPELASRDRDILNDQGVRVGFEEGEITEEEQAEIARLVAIAETEQRAKEETARRDNILLETYLSVDDIEDLRDRRLELLESQIKVTELYLNNLRKRLLTLQEEAEQLQAVHCARGRSAGSGESRRRPVANHGVDQPVRADAVAHAVGPSNAERIVRPRYLAI